MNLENTVSKLNPYEYSQNATSRLERSIKTKILRAVGVAAVCGLATMGTINKTITELQDERPSAIVPIDTNPYARDWIATFSGFASASLNGKPDDLACTVDSFDDRNVLAVQHRGEYNLDNIAEMLAKDYEQKNMQSLTLHGESAGGLMSIKVGAKLLKMGVNLTEIHLVTTPIAIEDIRLAKEHSRFIDLAYIAMQVPGFDGVFEYGTNIVSEFKARDNKDTMTKKFRIATNRTFGLPTDVLKGEVDLIKEGVDIDDIKELTKNNVNIIYFAPHQDSFDSLVNTDTAYTNLHSIVSDVVGSDWVKYYLKRVRVGMKHAPTTHSESEIMNTVWVNYTNARSVNSPSSIEVIGGLYPDCEETYRDVLYTLENGDYS